MPVGEAKNDLQGYWWLTSEHFRKGGKEHNFLGLRQFLVSIDASLEGVESGS